MNTHLLKILLTIVLAQSAAMSQAQKEQTFTVKEGMTISGTLPDSMIYLYPQFLKGSVVFNNGKQDPAVLNYNLIIGKIQFIKNNKDTLAVTNPGDVRVFVAGADTFLFNKVYFRMLLITPRIMLACHQYTKALEVRREAGYGVSNATMAVDSYASVIANDNSGLYKLKTSAETLFSICTDYFFTTGNNDFVPATQKNLIKLYPGKASEIKKYIKEYDINLKKVVDLAKLIRYVNSLPT